MASVNLLAAVVCTLFAASASAQNITVPLNETLSNVTTSTLPQALNASVVDTTSPVNATVSDATLAVYRAVKIRSLGLLTAFAAGDIVGVAFYVTPDVQLVLPNTSAPIMLQNVTTLLPFLARIQGSNATVSTAPSDLYFYAIDSTNALTVYETTAGGLGNVYITGFWQLINSTTSPNGTSWSVGFVSLTPAPDGTYVPQALPVFAATPDITLNATVNSTTTPPNTSLPANASIEAAVIAASTGLQGAINNATLSLANVTSQYVARGFQLVLPQTRSPIALNLTDPRVLIFFNALHALNTTGTAAGQQVVSYKQLNSEAAILLTSVTGVPSTGNAYLVQLWQYLNATAGTNTTTGVNTTALVNSTSIPLRKTWQITFASVNLAPPSAAGTVIAGAPLSPPTPAPTTPAVLLPSAPAPQTSAPAPQTSAPAPQTSAPAPQTSAPAPSTAPSPKGCSFSSPCAESPPPALSPQLFLKPPSSQSPSVGPIIGGVLAGAAVLLTFATSGLCLYCRKKRKQDLGPQPALEESAKDEPQHAGVSRRSGPQPRQEHFSFKHLQKATGHFGEASIIGRGSFGTVYKGVLSDGSMVAVKRLETRPGRKDIEERSWKGEVEALGKVRHKNLVPLLGVSVGKGERLLVFEYFPQGSLDRRLHHPQAGETVLTWTERLNIARSICQGLIYLHNHIRPPMVHRDIKAANILLTDVEPMDACIADFGLAHLVQDTKGKTSTMVKGTVPYMAPEYLHGGARFLSPKCDVYSFGMLSLELISGRPVVRQLESGFVERLLKVATDLVREGKVMELVDRALGNNYDAEEARNYIHVALACLRTDPSARPTMEGVGSQLALASVVDSSFREEDLWESEGSFADLGNLSSSSGVRSTYQSTVQVASRFVTPR